MEVINLDGRIVVALETKEDYKFLKEIHDEFPLNLWEQRRIWLE